MPSGSPTGAVIECGGKQYRVSKGDVLTVEGMKAKEGDVVELSTVLAVRQDGRIIVGRPYVPGARVSLRVLRHQLGPKIRVVKFKPKKRYLRVKGHRQRLSQVQVEDIALSEQAQGE
ncbi:MAG: 50S ribosomal protein L21 [Armatimonadetes bacterium]|nr:50S ribosomal protein L21 [Armatimonadota bacterium]MDW8120926.1 50S ribosomal protein L21 [Armatimonadota bacterium]